MRRIVLSQVASVAVPYFPTLSYKRHDFRNIIKNKMCVFFILSTTLPKTFHFVRRVWRDVIITVHMSSCKVAMTMIIC